MPGRSTILLPIILVFLFQTAIPAFCQKGFTERTRALYILDISRYVKFGEGFEDRPEFVLSVLDRDDQLYWEMVRLADTRKTIQGKPISIRLCAKTDQIGPSSVVFVNSRDGYQIAEVLDQILGKNTLLISEGYPFKSSMINFVAVDGKPQFEVNTELMKSEHFSVSQIFLSRAIKTLDDWESMYEETDAELELEKSITEHQGLVIEQQYREIGEQEKLIRDNDSILELLREGISQREKEIAEKVVVLEQQEAEISEQGTVIQDQVMEVRMHRETLAEQERDIRDKEMIILGREDEIRSQEEEIDMQNQRLVLQAEAIQKQRIIIYSAIIALLLVFGLVYFIWTNYRNKKRANELLKVQRDQIAYQKKHITDSIEYAKRIQRAILPSMELFTDQLDHFVLFKPRDIVSGDFYWVSQQEDDFIIIAADCTGHGVPGAFMSMLGVSLLNEIVLNEGIGRPDEILNRLREKIIDVLKQKKEGVVKDGMDMTVCRLDTESGRLLFAGANNPLYHIRGEELIQLKGDKMPVAIHEIMEPFTLLEIALEKGDSFYTFSDGFVDQFGGEMQKKFLARNFRQLLVDVRDRSMIEQAQVLDGTFEKYRGDLEQIDDVVVIGVRY